ncbi:MAG: hypothetical protein AABX96_04705 [Nanoarchaeota archaeon]
MPPSGFSQDAINGLLVFVRESYERTLARYKGRDLSEEATLDESIRYLGSLVEESTPLALDGTVSRTGIRGLQQFVSTNFRDLVKEIHEGKKEEGHAMQTEIEHIGLYLAQFKLNENKDILDLIDSRLRKEIHRFHYGGGLR